MISKDRLEKIVEELLLPDYARPRVELTSGVLWVTFPKPPDETAKRVEALTLKGTFLNVLDSKNVKFYFVSTHNIMIQ